MKWIGQHIYDLVARFRNDVYITGTLDVTSLGTFDASVTVAGKISLKDAGDSVFVGYEAGLNDDASANLNVGVGYQALRANTTGANNTAHGYQALYSNTVGDQTAVGFQALYSNTTGLNNVATGVQALYSNTTGSYNVATGTLALRYNTTGSNNTAVGRTALYLNTTGTYNTAVGYGALYSNTTGSYNAATGFEALRQNTTGASNTAHGFQALYYNTTGSVNVATGVLALYFNTTGSNNTAVGRTALYENTTGDNNIAVGLSAGRFIADGTTANTVTSNSVFLGYNTKALADSQTNQIVIGVSAVGLGSNTAILGNSSITKTQLQGKVGIGTASPQAKLHVADGALRTWTPIGGTTAIFESTAINRSFVTITGADQAELWFGNASIQNKGRVRYEMVGNNMEFWTNAVERMVISGSGSVGIGTTSPQNKLDIVGSLGRGAPVTKTTDFTVAATENWLIMNGTATITITLPTASSFTGRELMIKNIAAYTVISASSNVKPIDTDNAATAILPATAGSWCTLVSDGTNWVTMMN
jgi:hypothetical protein